MAEGSGLRDLVLRRYGVATAIAAEVASVQNSLMEAIREGIDGSPAKKALDAHVESLGATNGSRNQASTAGAVRWWVWYSKGKQMYLDGLWVRVEDIDARLGVRVESWMNQNIRGFSGTTFRKDVANWPPGDATKWVSEGCVVQQLTIDANVTTVDQLAAAAVTASQFHLVFLQRLYDEISNAAGSATGGSSSATS